MEEIECAVCGETFEVSPYREETAKYCSRECQSKGFEAEKTSIECEQCGTIFDVPPSRTNSARFCSSQCERKAKSKRWQGEGNPRWAGGEVTLECEWCADEYQVRPAVAENSRFCSLGCKGRAYAQQRRGADNPRWEGGGGREFYAVVRDLLLGARSWSQVRERELGDCCSVCGATESLHLHHIVPILAGGTSEPYNLITVCIACHPTVESFIQDVAPRPLVGPGV